VQRFSENHLFGTEISVIFSFSTETETSQAAPQVDPGLRSLIRLFHLLSRQSLLMADREAGASNTNATRTNTDAALGSPEAQQ
jgi:hypothetical protein